MKEYTSIQEEHNKTQPHALIVSLVRILFNIPSTSKINVTTALEYLVSIYDTPPMNEKELSDFFSNT